MSDISFSLDTPATKAKLESFGLPTIASPPIRLSPKFLILYGAPKVGKTTLLSTLKECLIIDVEQPDPGTKYLTCLNKRIETEEEFVGLAKLLKDLNRPYKYIAIDPIDTIEDWAERKATQTYRSSPVGKNFNGYSVLELPNGGGYMWLRNEFHRYLNMICKMADNVIIIGHLRDKMIEINGKEVSAKDLDLTGKIKTITCSAADAIGHIYRDPSDMNKIRVNFQSRETIACGSRCQHLKGMDIEFDWSKIYID